MAMKLKSGFASVLVFVLIRTKVESLETGEAPLWIASEVRFQSLLLFAEPASFQHCVSFSCGLILLKSRLGFVCTFSLICEFDV